MRDLCRRHGCCRKQPQRQCWQPPSLWPAPAHTSPAVPAACASPGPGRAQGTDHAVRLSLTSASLEQCDCQAAGVLCPRRSWRQWSRAFAATQEYQAPRTGQRSSSWASHSQAWLEAPEAQFTQEPGCFPTSSAACLVPIPCMSRS